jgi:hypothetical protein
MREHERASAVVRRVEPRTDAAWTERGLAELARRRTRARLRRGAIAVLATVAAAGVVIVLAWPRSTETARAPAHELPAAALPASDGIRFPDGSTVTPLAGASVVVREVTPARVEVVIERGAADVEVTRDPSRRFAVSAGPVRVEVLGTAFRVSLAPEGTRAEVGVFRGRVRVSWTGGEAVLAAGASGTFPPPSVGAQQQEPAAHADPLQEAPARRRGTRPPVVVVTHDDVPPDWRAFAREGEFARAYELLQAGDEPDDTLADLLLAADAARLSGHRVEALTYLDRAASEHAGDPRAPLASFTAARLLVVLGRHGEAAERFERALALEPRGSLAEDALAGAVEAHTRAGRRTRAATLGTDYLARFPDGRWAARVQQAIAEP